jgi:excisionase family DNA binding protein
VGSFCLLRNSSPVPALSSPFAAEEGVVNNKVVPLKKVPPTQRLHSVSEAAAYLGVARNTLIKLTENGEVTSHMFRGRRTYRVEDLDRYIDSLPEWKPQAKRSKGMRVNEKKD